LKVICQWIVKKPDQNQYYKSGNNRRDTEPQLTIVEQIDNNKDNDYDD